LTKARAKSQKSGDSVAERVATFIGRSMADLLNRRDALAKQMKEVDAQIAAVQKRVADQFGRFAGTPRRRRRGARKAAAGAKSLVRRVISDETRKKMADAARRRWAAKRAAKS
jgi:hypothetical protein